MQREYSEEDKSVIATGIVLSRGLVMAADDLTSGEERASHITIVALMHAVCLAELRTRRPSVTREQHRANLHTVLDDVMDYEERAAKVGF